MAPYFDIEEVNYIVSLKSFYSDIDFTSLTQTFNFWYDRHVEVIVIEWFCRSVIGTSKVPFGTPPKWWIKGNSRNGGLHSHLRTLARFRMMYDLVHAMQEDSIPERIRLFYDLQQSPTVNRLEREPTYSYKDLCDLSPVDMMRVYRPREKQEEHDWEFMRSNLEAYHKLIEGRMDGMDSEKKDRYTDMLKGRLDKSEQEQQ